MRTGVPIIFMICCFYVTTAGCLSTESGPPPGTTAMSELLAAGRAPVEVVAFRPAGNMVMPQFRLELKNLSDKPVRAVKWTALFFGADGKLLPEGKADGGYAELGGIAPGQTIVGAMPAREGAVRGRLVLASVIYEGLPPGAENNESMRMMTINLQWKNPSYEGDVAAAAR